MKRILSILLALCTFCACSPQHEEKTVETVTQPIVEEVFEQEEAPVEPELSTYEKDAFYLVESIEETHPSFALDDIPENYEQGKVEYLETVKTVRNQAEFYFASQKYLTMFNDGHTGFGAQASGINRVLNLKSLWHEGEQWLTDENGALTDTKVLAIGGVSVADIWATFRLYLPKENDSAYIQHRDAMRFDSFLKKAGVDVSKNEISVLLEKDGQQFTESCEFVPLTDYIATEKQAEETIRYEMIDDVFYIDMNKCIVDDNLKAVAAALTEAVANGQQKVIIDVRGNSGGDNQSGMRLLKAMNMREPVYTQMTRVIGTNIINKQSESSVESIKNPDIQLIVLSDEDVFSSANSICVWVQDGDLGQVIGRPSSNSPNAYGNVRYCTLPNLKLQYRISMDYWQRPDLNGSAELLEMDVYVPHGTDTLSVALELLAE